MRRATLALLVHALVLFGAVAPALAGVVVGTGGSAVPVSEGSPGAQYELRLDADPGEPVLVHFKAASSIDQIAPLRFTSADYALPKRVDVLAADDFVYEPTHTVSIEHQVRSEASGTALGPWEAPLTALVEDNDYPGLLVSPQGGLSGVEGDRVRWEVSLLSQPTGDVALSFKGDADGVVASATLVFTPATWNVRQVVELDLVDDYEIEGAHESSVSTAVSSTDPHFDALVVPTQVVSVADNDQPGIVLDAGPAGVVEVTEGTSPRAYTIRLESQPSSKVEIDVAALYGQVSVSPAILTFTSADWSSPQTITVAAVDDTVREASPAWETITHTSNSADPAYASPQLPEMQVSVTDNDTPGFLVEDPASMVLEEADPVGTEALMTVRLATRPSAEVRVRAVGDSQIMLPTSVLTFTTTNWDVPQTLRVQAYDDTAAEGDHVANLAFVILAPDEPTYSALGIPSRTFEIVDDDAGDASIRCVDGPAWERDAAGNVLLAEDPGAANHQVGCYLQLGTAPLSDVTVNVGLTPKGQVAVDQASVTFAAGEQGPKLLTFTAVDDFSAEAAPHFVELIFQVVSSDPVYGSIGLAPVALSIAENDKRGVRIVPDGPIEVREGGSEVAISVTLTSKPTSMVSLSLDAGTELELVGGAGSSLLFTTTNWNVPQQVQVKAVDDAWSEPARQRNLLRLSINSSDLGYLSLPLDPVPFDVVDNDVPGVVISHSGGGTEAPEGGKGDMFAVTLATRPRSPVTITIVPDAQLAGEPMTFTFTESNWNVPQQVDVASAQDTVFEGRHEGRFTFRASSEDAHYDSSKGTIVIPPVVVAIPDDEEGGATITESDGATSLTEAGGSDTYSVVLKAQPTSDVVIRPDGSGQAAANPPSITFTASNWNVAQVITLAAVQDEVDELDPHAAEVRQVVETTAAGWAGLALPAVTASIADDDAAEIVVTQSDDSTKVAEGSKKADTIGIRLASRPARDVVITAAPDPQLTLGTKPIVLTPAAWKDPVELSVLAVNDKEHEGAHTGSITFKVASEDPSFAKAMMLAITVQITDDDSDITIKPGEDGGGVLEEDEPTRKPGRGGGSGAGAGARSGHDDGGGASGERRTREGESRTQEGAKRTDDGLGGTTVGGARGAKDEEPQERAEELDNEVVSATERRKPRRKAKPNPVMRAMNRATEWIEENKENAATVGGLGLMAAGAGTFLLRGDPIKVAQRGLSSALPKGPASGGEGSGDRERARKPRGKKKRDEQDEDAPKS